MLIMTLLHFSGSLKHINFKNSAKKSHVRFGKMSNVSNLSLLQIYKFFVMGYSFGFQRETIDTLLLFKLVKRLMSIDIFQMKIY